MNTKEKNARVDIINDCSGQAKGLIEKIESHDKMHFVLAIAGTKVSDIEGISAAGGNPQLRRLTPAYDADLLISCLPDDARLPVSPAGIASPVVLTRAALSLTLHMTDIVDCGTFHSPTVAHIKAGTNPSECLSKGNAQSRQAVQELYKRGMELAESLAGEDIVVLAECVPGGTTTAQAVLTALGFSVDKLLSSSHPICNHSQRFDLVERGIKAAAQRLNLSIPQLMATFQKDPLAAVACLGDPMQAFACGFLAGRAGHGEDKITVLGGGSQMLAVWALASQIDSNDNATDKKITAKTLVATTKWVGRDPQADCARLAKLLGAPFVATTLNLESSGHPGLRAYEEGNVKEGVGAGAAILMAALMPRIDEDTIVQVIDSFYSSLI